MRVLVTGGAGFIGSHVADRLIRREDEVVVIDNFNNYYVQECGESFATAKFRNVDTMPGDSCSVHAADITSRNVLEKVWPEKIDAVVHLAARAGVRASLKNPELYRTVNVEGTRNVLEVGASRGVRHFVVASSSSVYGTNSKMPFSENDALENIVSPYAFTKKEMEELCRAFTNGSSDGITLNILRFFTVYGPRGRPDMAPFKFIDNVLRGVPIQKYGDGSTERDYTYIDDIVDGVVRAVDKGFPEVEVFNLGNNKPVSLNTFIELVEKAAGRKAVIEQMPVQEGDVPRTYADITKAKAMLGWQPTTQLETGLHRTAEWLKSTMAQDYHI